MAKMTTTNKKNYISKSCLAIPQAYIALKYRFICTVQTKVWINLLNNKSMIVLIQWEWKHIPIYKTVKSMGSKQHHIATYNISDCRPI